MPYLKILGPPELSIDGKPVAPFKKALALLVYLFVESGRTHSRGFLSELLWPKGVNNRADNSLRQSLHLLKTIFSEKTNIPVILTPPGHVHLNPEFSQEFDASGFFNPPPNCEILHDPRECPSCSDQLTGILLSIRGPILDDLTFSECDEFENWKTAIREDLTERARWACDRIMAKLEEEHQLGKAVRILDQFLKLSPLDEERTRTQMTLLWKMGDTQSAEGRYAILRKALKSELDVDPEPETRDLFEKIMLGPSMRKQVSPSASSEPKKCLLLEWRQATALVIDLHFTEALDDLFNTSPILEMLLKPIQEFGGVEWRITDHGFLAWFGTDGMSDRATIRATRAAQEIGRIIERIQNSISEHMEFRGGIHTGRILKNPQSDLTDPTGILSRSAMALCMQAPPGAILLSSDAYQTLRGQFPHIGTEPISLLGQKSLGYVLPSSIGQRRPIFPERPLLIGRDKEHQVFLNLYDENRGGVLLIDGEVGIGKSALARTFLFDGIRSGADFHTMECFPHTQSIPYSPLAELIRTDSGIHYESTQGSLTRQLFDYLQSLDIEPDPSSLDLLQDLLAIPKFQTPHSSSNLLSPFHQKMVPLLVKILNSWARRNPFIVLTEDIHWIDTATEKLILEALQDPALSRRIFFLFTQRTGEGPIRLSSLPRSNLIHLKPLSLENSCKMARALSGGISLSKQEMSRIVRLGEGIPLYLKDLMQKHSASPDDNNRASNLIGEFLESRLCRLGESRPLILIASVIGPRIPVDLLRIVAPLSSEPFDQRLFHLLKSELLSRSEPCEGWEETLSFRHALIQEKVMESLPLKIHQEIHRKVAFALQTHFPEQANERPEIVAYHFDRSGESIEAAHWYEKMGEISIRKGAFYEAEKALRRGLDILSHSHSRSLPDCRKKEFRLLILLGTLLIERFGQGHTEEVSQIFERAISLLDPKETLSPEGIIGLFRHWESLFAGTDLRAVRKVTDFIRILADRRKMRSDIQVYALFTHGCTSFWEGRFSQTNRVMRRCIDLVKKCSLDDDSFHLTNIAHKSSYCNPWGLWFEGRFKEARQSLDALLTQAESPDYPPIQKPFLLTFAAFSMRYFRHLDKTLALCRQLLDAINILGMDRWNPSEQGLRGWALTMQGHREGMDLILASLPLAQKAHPLLEIKHTSLLAEAYLALGETEKAVTVADSALEFSRTSGTVYFDAELTRLKGVAALRKGRPDEARAFFSKAISISRRQKALALQLRASTSLGQLLASEGHPQKVAPLFNELRHLLHGPEADPSLPDVQEALKTLDQVRMIPVFG